MNKKYDYLEIVTNFSEFQYNVFSEISNNDRYFSHLLHKSIINNVAGCHELFINSRDAFIKYMCEPSPLEELTRLECIIVSFLFRNAKFESFYGDKPIDIDVLGPFMICSFTNKTKTLTVNMNQLNMIYQNYIKYLHTPRGEEMLYGEDIFDVEDNTQFYDTPFYDSLKYRVQQLKICKKELIKMMNLNSSNRCMVSLLWDKMFDLSGKKFAYKPVCENVRKYIPESTLSTYKLMKNLKDLHIKMLETLLDSNLLEKYFDTTQTFYINGGNYNIESALKYYLDNAIIETLMTSRESGNSISNIEIVNKAISWCSRNGIKYKIKHENSDVLVSCKCNIYGQPEKGYKTYFYKNGVIKDFKLNMSTSIFKLLGN